MSFRIIFMRVLSILFCSPIIFSNLTAEEAKVSVDMMKVYESMSFEGTVVRTLPKGTPVFVDLSILGSEGEWCNIKQSAEASLMGWVLCSELERHPIEVRPTAVGHSYASEPLAERTVGISVAANFISTVVGQGPPKGNTKLKSLEEKIFQDMQRGQVNPDDVEQLNRERQKAFLEAGGDPSDIEGLKRAAMRDLATGGNESNKVLEEVIYKMVIRNQLKPVGDGGPALLAQLSCPKGIVFDKSGNLYIADSGHNRIRKVTTDGIITTIAGIGVQGFSGDGESALTAQLMNPCDVAVDSSGAVYISDSRNNVIRMVTPDQKIWTLAGDRTQGYGGDNGPSHLAHLSNPQAVELDPSGNLYIADTANHRIRKVDSRRIITTVAGNGTRGYAGDGGLATLAKLSAPTDLAFDREGNLYFVDTGNHCIRMITPEGLITTIFGADQNRSGALPEREDLIQLRRPTGIALDSGDNLFIVDSFQFRVLRVSPKGQVDIIAGGENAYSGDGGPANLAGLLQPQRLAVDSAGNLFISTDSGRIRKVGQVAVGH